MFDSQDIHSIHVKKMIFAIATLFPLNESQLQLLFFKQRQHFLKMQSIFNWQQLVALLSFWQFVVKEATACFRDVFHQQSKTTGKMRAFASVLEQNALVTLTTQMPHKKTALNTKNQQPRRVGRWWREIDRNSMDTQALRQSLVNWEDEKMKSTRTVCLNAFLCGAWKQLMNKHTMKWLARKQCIPGEKKEKSSEQDKMTEIGQENTDMSIWWLQSRLTLFSCWFLSRSRCSWVSICASCGSSTNPLAATTDWAKNG